jgi:hypothetical protein
MTEPDAPETGAASPPEGGDGDGLHQPAPTGWPMVMAMGACLLGAGLVLNLALSAVGLVLLVLGLAGWVGQLAPGSGHVHQPFVPPEQRARPIQPAPAEVEHLRLGMPGHRLRLPEKVHPYLAGVKGGIIGGVAMTAVPLGYGLFSGHGIWYPINLLAGMVLVGFEEKTTAELEQFSGLGLAVGIGIHAVMSVGLGLLYGVLLPMLPGRPIFWGGLIAPLLWTGLNHGLMGVVNPLMNRHVNWWWFLASQVVYGIVAGVVITRTEKVAVEQTRRQLLNEER